MSRTDHPSILEETLQDKELSEMDLYSYLGGRLSSVNERLARIYTDPEMTEECFGEPRFGQAAKEKEERRVFGGNQEIIYTKNTHGHEQFDSGVQEQPMNPLSIKPADYEEPDIMTTPEPRCFNPNIQTFGAPPSGDLDQKEKETKHVEKEKEQSAFEKEVTDGRERKEEGKRKQGKIVVVGMPSQSKVVYDKKKKTGSSGSKRERPTLEEKIRKEYLKRKSSKEKQTSNGKEQKQLSISSEPRKQLSTSNDTQKITNNGKSSKKQYDNSKEPRKQPSSSKDSKKQLNSIKEPKRQPSSGEEPKKQDINGKKPKRQVSDSKETRKQLSGGKEPKKQENKGKESINQLISSKELIKNEQKPVKKHLKGNLSLSPDARVLNGDAFRSKTPQATRNRSKEKEDVKKNVTSRESVGKSEKKEPNLLKSLRPKNRNKYGGIKGNQKEKTEEEIGINRKNISIGTVKYLLGKATPPGIVIEAVTALVSLFEEALETEKLLFLQVINTQNHHTSNFVNNREKSGRA